jgi:hypothetical protein
MVDTDTFLTTLYVMVDDFGKTSLPSEPHPGPQAILSRSEVVTLAIFGQWQGFGSERGFYRYAQRCAYEASTALGSRRGMPSGTGRAACLAWRISAEAKACAGMKDSTY